MWCLSVWVGGNSVLVCGVLSQNWNVNVGVSLYLITAAGSARPEKTTGSCLPACEYVCMCVRVCESEWETGKTKKRNWIHAFLVSCVYSSAYLPLWGANWAFELRWICYMLASIRTNVPLKCPFFCFSLSNVFFWFHETDAQAKYQWSWLKIL